MSQKMRMLMVVIVLLALMGMLIAYNEVMRHAMKSGRTNEPRPDMISLFTDGVFHGQIIPADLDRLPTSSFAESEQGKDLKGWLLRDVIGLYVDRSSIGDDSIIIIYGVGEKRGEKAVTLTWKEVSDPAAHVMLHPSKNGQSLKLVSTLQQLDTRDEWIQGVVRIDLRKGLG